MTKIAIVTGSDSGIGKATAVVLAERGFDIGVTWHEDREGAEGTVEEIRALGRKAELAHLDLTNLPDAASVVDELADALGGVDVLVNNAGTGGGGSFLEHTWEDWRHVLSVDLDGPFLLAQRAVKRMVANGTGGSIVNITSVHEHVPKTGSSSYCAAKGGLGLLTKVMALELAEHGIRVNAVAPGEISTPMTGQHDEDPHAQERPGLPMQRPGDAREIATMVAYLASDEASYVTGSSFIVDGGLMLMAAEANSRLKPQS